MVFHKSYQPTILLIEQKYTNSRLMDDSHDADLIGIEKVGQKKMGGNTMPPPTFT